MQLAQTVDGECYRINLLFCVQRFSACIQRPVDSSVTGVIEPVYDFPFGHHCDRQIVVTAAFCFRGLAAFRTGWGAEQPVGRSESPCIHDCSERGGSIKFFCAGNPSVKSS